MRGEASVPGYDVGEVLGRGGFSTVYRAVQQSVGREVALKVLDAWEADAELERRFRTECRSLGSLSWHPHIVAVFDAGLSTEGQPFMSMELLERGSLAAVVRNDGPMDPDEVLRVGNEVADALSAAHAAGVLHRDLKPANVLIGRRGEYLLADFGIAAFADATRSTSQAFSGTLAFCAPEVLLGQRATTASDIFSLGVTLHTLLRGDSTFAPRDATTSPGAVVQRVINDPVPPLPPGTPAGLVAVIERATAKAPEDRYADIGELAAALAAVGGAVDEVTSPRVPADDGATVVRPVADAGETVLRPPAGDRPTAAPPPVAPPATPTPVAPPPVAAVTADPGPTVLRPGSTPTLQPETAGTVAAKPDNLAGKLIAAAAVVLGVLLIGAIVLALTVRPDSAAAPATTTTTPVPSDPEVVRLFAEADAAIAANAGDLCAMWFDTWPLVVAAQDRAYAVGPPDDEAAWALGDRYFSAAMDPAIAPPGAEQAAAVMQALYTVGFSGSEQEGAEAEPLFIGAIQDQCGRTPLLFTE